MIKKLPSILLMLSLFGCIPVTQNYQDSVVLPDGATLKIAQEIGMSVWNAGYREKIRDKFPEISDKQLNTIFIKWIILKSTTGNKKTSILIITGMQYQNNGIDPKIVVKYGKTLIEKAVEEYFKK